mgnify:CR=1 FL=1
MRIVCPLFALLLLSCGNGRSGLPNQATVAELDIDDRFLLCEYAIDTLGGGFTVCETNTNCGVGCMEEQTVATVLTPVACVQSGLPDDGCTVEQMETEVENRADLCSEVQACGLSVVSRSVVRTGGS